MSLNQIKQRILNLVSQEEIDEFEQYTQLYNFYLDHIRNANDSSTLRDKFNNIFIFMFMYASRYLSEQRIEQVRGELEDIQHQLNEEFPLNINDNNNPTNHINYENNNQQNRGGKRRMKNRRSKNNKSKRSSKSKKNTL